MDLGHSAGSDAIEELIFPDLKAHVMDRRPETAQSQQYNASLKCPTRLGSRFDPVFVHILFSLTMRA
jgi:hypothetical protein